ncbi:MAG: S8 family serine peptidase [Anaerolineales bacterium]
MKRVIFNIFLILALMLAFSSTVFAQGNGPKFEKTSKLAPGMEYKDGVYIVLMIDDPVVAYEGGINGLQATKPGKGQKINPNSAAVKKYKAYLDGKHDAALEAVGAKDNKIYSYGYSFNGFAATLTGAQAKALAAQSEVLTIWSDELRQVETDNSPNFLGLTAEGGAWEMGYKGEDVIIGVIDTGIWPEHPSFSDQEDFADRPGESGKRTRVYGPPPADWHGICQSGENWSQDDCNNKLIGARYFKGGVVNNLKNKVGDYLSARDADGHGTHTASTAGGNANVPASIFGIDRGTVSGIAPRARIAMYKGCWVVGCFTSDLVGSIDFAVADGVDVINYSIGSSATTLGPDDISFLFAADAGVYVATSAGNSGPEPETTGSPGWTPWVTSVGANTQDRAFISDITLSGPGTPPTGVWGGSITGGVDDFNLVDAEGIEDVTGDTSGMCLNAFSPGTFQPNDAVLCNQYNFGVPRVQRVAYVAGGGGGAVLFHNSAAVSTMPTDNHVLPTVHMLNDVGQPLKNYLVANPGQVTVSFTQGNAVYYPDDPRAKPYVMASFSSRGPNGGAFDIIKPDITAPGVNILAGNTPTPDLGAPGQLFQAIMGTSMSSPHVAGAFAVLKDAHPDWSQATAKSALMTTASQGLFKEDGVTLADPFDMGAGHLNPNPALDPGLVYDVGFLDYLAFLCGNNPANIGQGTCNALASLGFSLDPSELNLASIGIAELAGFETVTRTVKNVGPAGTYEVSVSAPPGIVVAVSPSSLTLAEDESASYEVTFTATGAATLGQWAFGSLTWSHGPHSVRSPIAVKPVALAAPGEVAGTGTDGSLSFDVTFGYSGAYTAGTHGLAPADMQAGTVVDDPSNDINTALVTGVGITEHEIDIPAGTAYARFSLFDDYTDGDDDLDLYIFDSNGEQVGGSGSPTSAEEVNLVLPDAGTYTVVVHGWQTDGPDANYTLFSWSFGLVDDRGNMTVTAPAAATLGATETITVDWAGLTPGTKYLGAVSHSNGGLLGLTVVRVDTD